jgi:hypothetical protein
MIDNIEDFIVIDKRISGAEDDAAERTKDSLRDRWEFGKLMLTKRKGKQLPNGLLDELATATGKSRSELQYRMRFAERYPTEDEVWNVFHTYKTWLSIIHSLPKPPSEDAPPKQPPTRKPPKVDPESLVADKDNGLDISRSAVAERYGVAESTTRDSIKVAEGIIAGRERGRDEATNIDWSTVPGTAKDKLSTLERKIRKEVEAQVRAEVEAEKAEWLERQKSMQSKATERTNEQYRQYTAVIKANRDKGVMVLDDFNVIRSCLHPDSRQSVTDEKLALAFRLFNDPAVKMRLVKGGE